MKPLSFVWWSILGLCLVAGAVWMMKPSPETVGPLSIASLPLDAVMDTPVPRTLTTEEVLRQAAELEENGKWGEALSLLQEGENTGLGTKEVWFAMGRLYTKQGQYAQAANAFQRVLAEESAHGPTLVELMYLALLQEQYQALQVLYERIPESYPEREFYRGVGLLLQGRSEEGYNVLRDVSQVPALASKFQEYNRALLAGFEEFRLYSGGSGVHLKAIVARAFLEQGEAVLAERLLRQVITEKEDYIDGWVLLGYSFYTRGMYAEANTAFETAYALDSVATDIQFYLGITKEKLGQHSEALQYLAMAETNGYPLRGEVLRRMADVYVTLEEYERAVELYEEVLDVADGVELSAYIRPLWIYADILSLPDRALALAEEAHRAAPQDAMALNFLGWAYLAKQDYGQAERYLLQALSKDRGLAAAYLNLGKVYEGQGDVTRATQAYQRAYHMDGGTSVGNAAAASYNRLVDGQ